MKEFISSKSNQRIKNIVKLAASPHSRNESKMFVAEGLRLCTDAVKSGLKPIDFYFTQQAAQKHPESYNLLCNASENFFETTNEIFSKISNTVQPQGFLCVFKMPQIDFKIDKNGKYITACNIADPSNLGAICRTAEALGVSGVFVCGSCDIYNPKALRASMGALFRLKPVVLTVDEMFETMQKNNIPTYASVPSSVAENLEECDFSSGAAILIGNEANGLEKSVIDRCSHTVTIKMKGRAESLNAAAAAAILMYEMTK